MQFGLTSLSESLGIDDETVLSIKLSTKDLKKDCFKGVKHLTVLGEPEMCIAAAEV
jgi:hypothetical protein